MRKLILILFLFCCVVVQAQTKFDNVVVKKTLKLGNIVTKDSSANFYVGSNIWVKDTIKIGTSKIYDGTYLTFSKLPVFPSLPWINNSYILDTVITASKIKKGTLTFAEFSSGLKDTLLNLPFVGSPNLRIKNLILDATNGSGFITSEYGSWSLGKNAGPLDQDVHLSAIPPYGITIGYMQEGDYPYGLQFRVNGISSMYNNFAQFEGKWNFTDSLKFESPTNFKNVVTMDSALYVKGNKISFDYDTLYFGKRGDIVTTKQITYISWNDSLNNTGYTGTNKIVTSYGTILYISKMFEASSRDTIGYSFDKGGYVVGISINSNNSSVSVGFPRGDIDNPPIRFESNDRLNVGFYPGLLGNGYIYVIKNGIVATPNIIEEVANDVYNISLKIILDL